MDTDHTVAPRSQVVTYDRNGLLGLFPKKRGGLVILSNPPLGDMSPAYDGGHENCGRAQTG
jgi:hypothetical protein